MFSVGVVSCCVDFEAVKKSNIYFDLPDIGDILVIYTSSSTTIHQTTMSEVSAAIASTKTVTATIEQAQSSSFLVGLAYNANNVWAQLVELLMKLPGGALIINYIKASHKNDPWRTVLEVLLALFAVKYFLASRYSQDERDKMVLSKRETDELIEEWTPEPIVLDVSNEEHWQLETNPLIKGPVTKRVTIQNYDNSLTEDVLNFASLDFLGMSMNNTVKDKAIECIKEVGVGACGPPNFYGTQSVHVRVCEDLAKFLDAADCIIYGQDYTTPISVLPCFLKRGDIVIVDGGANIALQKAALISRCNIEWFNHNDLDHLEEILESLTEDLNQGPLNRRFIVTEGLSENFGDSPDLKRLVEIKNKYKFRLILDESTSIGTLGNNGRGLAEVYNIPRSDIEITIGSMARAFGASGGFCVGNKDMIYHQILTSNAYVFSAALPPYVAKSTSAVIQLLTENEKSGQVNPYIAPLSDNSEYLHSLFAGSPELKNYITVKSCGYSPSLHIRISSALRKELNLPESYGGPGSIVLKAVKNGNEELYFDSLYNLESYKLQEIINESAKSKVLPTRTKRILHHELLPVVPELILHLSALQNKNDLDYTYSVVSKAIINTLDNWRAKGY
ncbi:serine palmitoyltransferase component [Pichia californica]|uniref:serine C-palmitoyltransferase n=1 Tax=Pichia californica TaxID=460514 RepID=A0A9P6WPF8_9ASCO|nr:serine palmitoyltransferase component [[Candida] californica]